MIPTNDGGPASSIGVYRGKTIGVWPLRSRWYSVCSKHFEYREGCELCAAGHYLNSVRIRFGHFFHNHFYRLWHWWVNRPNSKSRRFLEEVFPGLKGKSK